MGKKEDQTSQFGSKFDRPVVDDPKKTTTEPVVSSETSKSDKVSPTVVEHDTSKEASKSTEPAVTHPTRVGNDATEVDVKSLALKQAEEAKLRELLKTKLAFVLEHATAEELVAELQRRNVSPDTLKV